MPGLANHSARTRVADLICRGGASGQDFLLCARAEGGGISSFLRIYCEPCTSGLTPGKAAASYLGKLTGGASQRASEPASQRASQPASQRCLCLVSAVPPSERVERCAQARARASGPGRHAPAAP
eukprot:SAG25_NODE_3934_length_925_cov_0.554479_3_plen_125_part_00